MPTQGPCSKFLSGGGGGAKLDEFFFGGRGMLGNFNLISLT